MKFLIASDIHGSSFYTNKLVEIFYREKADKIILLGDIYNHGPRNDLPNDYDPMDVAKTLNGLKDNLIVVKGNCDSDVDKMISEFDFLDYFCVIDSEKLIFFTHGHVYNKNILPKINIDAIIYGHTHEGVIVEENGKTIANSGSISMPKNNSAHSYLILEKGILTLKDIEGNIITSKKI